MFLFLVLISWLIFLYVLYKKTGKSGKYSKGILALLIFSIIVNVHLGLNYVASYSPQQDGIVITNWLSFLIIGEDGWSISLFKQKFDYSTAVTITLLVLYCFSLVVEKEN